MKGKTMFYAGWFLLAVVIGIGASGRGRSGFGWFLLSLLLSPLIGFVLLVLLPPLNGQQSTAPSPQTHVKCPDCAELVLAEARVCKHCGAKLVPIAEQQPLQAVPQTSATDAIRESVGDGASDLVRLTIMMVIALVAFATWLSF
jgi:hypothetical protein